MLPNLGTFICKFVNIPLSRRANLVATVSIQNPTRNIFKPHFLISIQMAWILNGRAILELLVGYSNGIWKHCSIETVCKPVLFYHFKTIPFTKAPIFDHLKTVVSGFWIPTAILMLGVRTHLILRFNNFYPG